MNIIKKIISWIKVRSNLEKPLTPPPQPKAVDVVDQYIVTKYHNQNICLRKTEIQAWNRMDRKNRRAMARKFEMMEKRGEIRFEKINGRMVAIKNKDYEAMANTRKSRSDKA